MKERPILFSGPMIRAILDGRKTVTRRVVKPQPPTEFSAVAVADEEPPCSGNIVGTVSWCLTNQAKFDMPKSAGDWLSVRCPYGKTGDQLLVRETWQYAGWTDDGMPFIRYRADGAERCIEDVPEEWGERVADVWAELSTPENRKVDGLSADRRWRSAIHIPWWACRITLEVVSVRAERVQNIGKDGRKAADVLAEGITREQIQRMQFENVFHPDDLPAMAFGSLWESINGKGSWASNPWVWRIEFRRINP